MQINLPECLGLHLQSPVVDCKPSWYCLIQMVFDPALNEVQSTWQNRYKTP